MSVEEDLVIRKINVRGFFFYKNWHSSDILEPDKCIKHRTVFYFSMTKNASNIYGKLGHVFTRWVLARSNSYHNKRVKRHLTPFPDHEVWLKKRRKSDTANYLPKDLNDRQHTQFSAMNLCPPPATPLRRPPYDHFWNPFIWEQIWN